MGHGVSVDVVPFAAHHCFEQNSYTSIENLPEEKQMLLLPESYAKGELCDNPKSPTALNGWTYADTDSIGKKKDIYGDRWEKEEFRVWLVNEHQCENVGEFAIAVVGDDRGSVEEFLKDFNVTGFGIEETEAVQRWG